MIRLLIGVLAGAWLFLGSSACAREGDDIIRYDPEANAAELIDTALAKARDEGKHALIIFGADWCHDSRGLVDHMHEDERLSAFLETHFVTAQIDVGMRHRNIDQLNRFGVRAAFGTPTLVVADGDGQPLNGQTAHDWRTANDASTDDIIAYLSDYAGLAYSGDTIASVDFEAAMQAWQPYVRAYVEVLRRRVDEGASEDEVAPFMEYITGLARSITRLEMGRMARNQDRVILSTEQLTALGLESDEDLTETVIERMDRRAMDLTARFERERQETLQALSEDKAQ